MEIFNQLLKKELNNHQRQAVTHKKGPIIVVAGAGSGKTRVITCRMANLILNQKSNPEKIIALTFTNKAAGEMKKRLKGFLGIEHKLPFVGTFHSYCLQQLRSHPKLLPFTEFSIFDDDDQKALVKKILKKHGLEKQFLTNEIIYQISNIKNKWLPGLQEEFFDQPIFKEIYLRYETEKSSAHAFDFDDLILQVLKLFKNNKKFKDNFQKKIEHILVDEYQDTNMVQHELLKCMALNSKKKFILKSICIVGDEDQSIYSWRGAMATNMLQFQKDFDPVTKIKIEQNYRTVQPILDAANNVIKNNKTRTKKQLWSKKKAKEKRILSINCRSGLQEADIIANFISSLPKEQKLGETAILYRTHFQSRNIEEALIRNSIPYKIVGGIRFYERREIKDLLAYLRLVVNPIDRKGLFRIINCPTRGLGAKFEELLYTQWNINPLLNFKQLLKYILKNFKIKLPKAKRDAVEQFLEIFKNLTVGQNASLIINHILKQTDYLIYLQKTFDQKEAETKIENVNEFVQSINSFERRRQKNGLDIFLQEIALLQEKIENKENIENEVLCMTLHAAKGLEFDNVIITGLEDGLFPSFRSFANPQALEEERRLFYVGLTRAKERALLLHAQSRHSFGQINDQVESRFLNEIPSKLTEKFDVTEMTKIEVKSYLNKWLGNKQKTVFTFKDFKQNLKSTIKNKKFPKKNPTLKPSKCLWKKNQIVAHKIFGPGIIKKVEKKSETEYYITAKFKSGEKKILSNFLNRI